LRAGGVGVIVERSTPSCCVNLRAEELVVVRAVGASLVEQVHGCATDKCGENGDENADGESVRLRWVLWCRRWATDRCGGFLGLWLLDHSIGRVFFSGDDVHYELDLAGLTGGTIPDKGDEYRAISVFRHPSDQGAWCDAVRVTEVALGVQVLNIIETQRRWVSGIDLCDVVAGRVMEFDTELAAVGSTLRPVEEGAHTH